MDLQRLSVLGVCVALLLVRGAATTGGEEVKLDAGSDAVKVAAEQMPQAADQMPQAAVLMDKGGADAAKSEMQIIEMSVNADDMEELMALDEEIAKAAENAEAITERQGRATKNKTLKEQADALTDEEINEIMQMIAFPPDQQHEISEDSEAYDAPSAQRNQSGAAEAEIEPRAGTRTARAAHSRGYYILAFSPLEGPVVPYTKLDVIPAERSMDGDLADKDDEVLMASSDEDEDESRMLSKKKLSRYIRRMMKQIRKGTRKIQRKTRFKSAESEPSVENFLRKLYQTRQQLQPKKPTSWFSW